MHTQTESAQEHPAGTALNLSSAAGLGLYLLTLAVEAMLGAGVRWLLFYLGAAILGDIVPLGLSAEELAWAAAVAPLVYSAIGLAFSGRGRLWRLRIGARRMSSEEHETLLAALELLRIHEPCLNQKVSFYVLDDPLPAAAVRGRALILTRGLIESESLAAVLGHELGHIDSLDGRLTEALQRLAVWADPLGAPDRHGAPQPGEDLEPCLPWSGLRLFLRLAGGGIAEQLLAPLWSTYWRTREYAADDYAASLGQAEDLARHLSDFEQSFDAPQPGLVFKTATHPPVALRIERLQEHSMGGGSK